MAKAGDLDATKILFDRTMGRPLTPVLISEAEDQRKAAGKEVGNDVAIIRHFLETDPEYLIYLRDKRLADEPGVKVVLADDFFANKAHQMQREREAPSDDEDDEAGEQLFQWSPEPSVHQ